MPGKPPKGKTAELSVLASIFTPLELSPIKVAPYLHLQECKVFPHISSLIQCGELRAGALFILPECKDFHTVVITTLLTVVTSALTKAPSA